MNQLFLSAAVALAAFLSFWSVFKVASFLTHIGQGLFATKAGQSLWKLRYLAGLLLGMWLLEIPPLFSGGPYTPIPRVSEGDLTWELFRNSHLKPGVPVIIVASTDPYGQGVSDVHAAAASALSPEGNNLVTRPTSVGSAGQSSPVSRNDEKATCELSVTSGACVSVEGASDGSGESITGKIDSEGVNSDKESRTQFSSSSSTSSSSSSSIAARTARAGEAYREVPKQLLAQCGDVHVNVMSETIQYFLEFLDESGTKWLLDAALRALGEGDIEAYVAARGDRALRDVAATTMGLSAEKGIASDIATGSNSPLDSPPPPPLDSVPGLEEGARIDSQEEEEVVVVPWLVWCLRRTPWLRQLVAFVEVAARPMYLSDIREERLECPNVTRAGYDSSFLALSQVERHFLAHYPRDPSNPHAKAYAGSITSRTPAAPLTYDDGIQYDPRGSDRGSSSSSSSSSSRSSTSSIKYNRNSSNSTQDSNLGRKAVSWAERLKNRKVDFGDWEVARNMDFDPHTAWFWGGTGTSSYPLHRDLADADAFFTVFTGCKEFVIIRPEERQHLHWIDLLPHIPIWSDDVFDAPFQHRPNGVRKEYAWRGVLRPGETLFLPGEMLHAVRNVCPSTVSICRRSWRSSTVRNVAGDINSMFQESSPEGIAQRHPGIMFMVRAFETLRAFISGQDVTTSDQGDHFDAREVDITYIKHVNDHSGMFVRFDAPPPPPP